MTYLLGVDLGTTFTAAAVADGTPPTVVGLGNRALQVPSVLFLTDDGFIVGEAAEQRGLADPARLVREFKRRLGDHVPLLVGGSPFSAELLTARLLQWVVARVTERMGDPPGEVILTHPANWGPYKMEVLSQVIALADVGSTSWVPEPVAAAAQYATQARVAVGERLAIYDFGGGTFDTCVLEKTQSGFAMLGTPDGVEHLGGVDLDEALFSHVLELLRDRMTQVDTDDDDVTVGLARLRRDCIEAKEALSSDVDVVLPVSLPGLITSVRVTRSEFEALIRPALTETVAALGRTLRSANVEPTALARIVLVGGSSRIPLVTEMLHREFDVATALDADPKHDVVLGALHVGRGDQSEHSTVRRAPAPALTPSRRMPGLSAAEAPPISAAESGRTSLPPGASTASAVAGDIGAVPPTQVERRAPELPGSEDTTIRSTSPRRRRALGLLGVGVGAVVAGVVVGLVVVNANPGSNPGPTPPATAAPTSSPPPSPTPTVTPPDVPRSTPLTASQLIVPMQVDGNWDLYLADTTAEAPVQPLIDSDLVDISPALSPDLATVVYIHNKAGDPIRRLRVAGAADGRDDRPLFDEVPSVCAGNMYRPAWNPADPNVLAAPCRDADGRHGLYLMRVDGTVLNQVDLDEERIGDATFSPDGSRLAFWAGDGDGFDGVEGDDGGELYTVAGDGKGKPRRLTRAIIGGQDADPVWSPNGETIAFRRRTDDGTKGGNTDIYTVAANGSGAPVRLTDAPSEESDPSWSPAGDQIAFKSNAAASQWPGDPVPRVWVMDATGENRRVLWTLDAPFEQAAPAWSRR